MCGIAGAIGPTATPKPRLGRALRALRHRGPDHQAQLRLHHGPAVIDLLHTRLSIIDLDPRANQPMTIDGRAIVFNGEIYNYTELRRQLEARGHCFRTASDTEVLLRCWIEYGYDAFERLDGMWALAIYDTRRHRLVLSRDRLGEKPLYLWPTNGRLHFASETRALTALVRPVCESLGLHLHIDRIEGALHRHPVPDVRITVTGADRAGIVAQVTGGLAEAGLNILNLESAVAGSEAKPLYIMHIEGQAREGIEALRAALEIVTREGIEASLAPMDTVIG